MSRSTSSRAPTSSRRARAEGWWDREHQLLLESFARRYGVYPGWFDNALTEDDRAVLRLRPSELVTWDYGKGDHELLNAGRSISTEP